MSTNKRLLISVVVLTVGLAVFGACRNTEEASQGFSVEEIALDVEAAERAFIPTLDGPLRILSATPYGTTQALAPDQPIAVTFSRPMVALGDAPPPDPGTLTTDPAVTGSLRWEGTQTLVFTPETPWPPATPFTIRLAPLPSLDGEPLAEPFTWRFETPRPQLVVSTPARGEPFAEPGAPLRLEFNQPIVARGVDQFITLATERGRDVPFTVRTDGDSTLLVRPKRNLTPATRHTLRLLPGLPSAVGPLGLRDTTTVEFTTYGPLRLTGVDQSRSYYDDEPGFDPRRGVRLTFTTPVRFGDLRRAVALSPSAELPPGVEARDASVSTTHTLPLDLAPETRYTLTIPALDDVFGQTVRGIERSFLTRAYQPSLAVPAGLLVLEADESAGLPLRVTNVETVRYGLQPLRADEIVPLLRAYDRGHWYGELKEDETEPQPVAAEQTFRPDAARNVPSTVPLPLDAALSGETGVVGIHIAGVGRRADAHRAIAQVTRLGITAKFSPHQNLFFVTELATAEPVAGARVTVRGDDNRVHWEGTTDDEGRALSPGWAGLGLERPNRWNEPRQYVFVERGGDLAFTSSLYRDGLDPYRFDVDYDWSPEAQTEAGSVFSDRGLYRTGETAFLKAILRARTDGDWRPIRDSVHVLIRSPRDELVLDRRLRPSARGTFDLDWTAPANAEQGIYTVRVAYADDTTATSREPWERGDIAAGSFRVEAFRRATFEVTARTPAEGYVVGDFFEGTIEGRYLFGATMGGQPVQYRLARTPSSFTPPGFDAFRFGPLDRAYGYDEIARGDTVLTADGTLVVRVPLEGTEQGGPAELRWEGTVTDPARQQQSGRTVVPLHPGLFYIGLRPRTSYLDLGASDVMPVDVVTVDPNGKPVSAEGVTVELFRRQWNSVREVGSDGRLRWRSEMVEEPMGERTLATSAGRLARVSLPVREGGSYLVRATGRDVRGNPIRSEAYFYAAGSGYVAWERADDDRIDLVPDRTTYAPGETARVMVQSPYESATALVTVEREGILSSRVMTLAGSAPQIEIPLGEEHLPNAFVSVVLLSGRTARPSATDDPGAPSFKMGYATLRVDPGRRHLRVEVEPDVEQARPGDEVAVDLRLRDAAGRGVAGEIAFSAADAGVLNLIGYALPDPFDTFYGPRPLAVTTSETLSNLVRQRSFGQKEEDVGGGGGDGSDLLRKDFSPLAHWAPAVQTDARGRARVTFRLPESLTTFRLMATAVAGNQFGAGQADLVVTQPLVLQPALPRFARLDDRFEAGVLVSNRTEAPGEVTVTAEATGLRLRGDATRTIRLEAGATREVRFGWTAESVGEASVQFGARLGNERDAFATTLPVVLPTTKEVSATFASTDSTAREALRLPADHVPGLGSLRVTLASTALAGLDGATRYLFGYPYGCLEQQTSRVRPLLAGDVLLDAFDLDPLGGDREEVVETWLAGLGDFWTGDGFGLWAGSRHANPYLTAYVVLALAEADAAGFTVPADLRRDALTALDRTVRNRSEKPDYYGWKTWGDTRALSLYALARHGHVLATEIDALANAPDLVSVEGVSHLLRTIALTDRGPLEPLRRPLLDRLRSRVRVESTTAYLDLPDGDTWGWIFASDTRATAHGLAALAEAAPTADTQQLGQRMIRYLIRSREGGHWASTQDNAAVIDAFAAYFDAFETAPPDFTAEVRVAGRRVLRESFRGRSLDLAEATVGPDAWPSEEAAPIAITTNGTGRAYYALTLETYTTAPQEALSSGLTIQRRLERLDDRGQPAGTLTPTDGALRLDAGALVRVTLRLASPTARSYVVVDDALPAGLEALNAAFETTASEVAEQTGADAWWGSFNHTEFRDDRVLLFADFLRPGEHTYTYVARATTPGTFVHPPARAEAMYHPETHGRTRSGRLVVRASDAEVATR